MKTITLINPEEANLIFEKWSKFDSTPYFIHVLHETNIHPLDKLNPMAKGDDLKVYFGKKYTIPLEENVSEFKLELKEFDDIGLFLRINDVNEIFVVYKHADQEDINLICRDFSDVSILDFGTFKNQALENLDFLIEFSRINVLNINHCPNLVDISGIQNCKLNSLYIDSFGDTSQFVHISSSGFLETLSQNLSDLRNTKHLSNLKSLRKLYLVDNANLKNINGISHLSLLQTLSLSGCDKLNSIAPLSNLSSLSDLDLSHCTELDDLSEVNSLISLKNLILDGCENLSMLPDLSNNIHLTRLDLYGCDNLTDIQGLSSRISLTSLNLSSCDSLEDFSPLTDLTGLKVLRLECNTNLEDLSCLHGAKNLEEVYFGENVRLTNLQSLSLLPKLRKIILNDCSSLLSIESLKGLEYLEELNLSGCENLEEINAINSIHNLRVLNLDYCSSLIKLPSLNNLNKLEFLYLNSCIKLNEIVSVSALINLKQLDLIGCQQIIRINPLIELKGLKKLNLLDCPNIRDFEKLASLPELRELKWIDPLACSEVLMQCALNRQDKSYILEHSSQWIKEISRSKDAVRFCSLVLRCVGLLPTEERSESLSDVCTAMRERGLQAERTNDLDAFTWETWCTSVLELGTEDIERSFTLAVANLDIARETEVVLGPLIVASASWIELHPSEKQHVLSWVHTQLQLLEEYPEAQRQIAPSAAVFFASLNDKEQVNFWLAKATDEKAPLWREKVLLALVTFYAKKQVFSEARRLISEIRIEDQKDKAIVETASAMAQLHPVDAAFLLDDVKDLNLSSAAARNLLEIPEVLSQPQGIYQLLLHLQGDPEELASCLEAMIHKDPEGKVADAVSSLFVHQASSGPSASVLLELCKHPVVGQFVKPWKLEELMEELNKTVATEQKQYIPTFIDLLESRGLIDKHENEMMNLKMLD